MDGNSQSTLIPPANSTNTPLVPQEAPPKKTDLGKELGGSGTYIYSGFLDPSDYNKDLTGNTRIDIYDQMRFGDSTVKAALLAMKLPLLSANWFIQEAEGEANAKKHSEFVSENLFNGMDDTWYTFLRQALTYLDYGAYHFEKVFEMREGKIVWKKFSPRLPKTIFRYSLSDGKTAGITQILPQGKMAEIPSWKLLRFINEQEGDNYEGISVLRPAYKHWFMKETLYKIQAMSAERQGLGVPRAKTPPNITDTEKRKLEELLRNIRANSQAFIMHGMNVDVEFMDMKGQSLVDPSEAIGHHDREITKAVLAQFLELGSTDSGSRALSEDHSALFLLSLQAVAKQVQEVMNDSIRQLIDLNFPGVKKYPTLAVGKIGLTDYAKMAEAISKFSAANLLTPDLKTEQSVRELIGFPEKEEAEYKDPTIVQFEHEKEMQRMASHTDGDMGLRKDGDKKKVDPKPLHASEVVEDIRKFRDALDNAITAKLE